MSVHWIAHAEVTRMCYFRINCKFNFLLVLAMRAPIYRRLVHRASAYCRWKCHLIKWFNECAQKTDTHKSSIGKERIWNSYRCHKSRAENRRKTRKTTTSRSRQKERRKKEASVCLSILSIAASHFGRLCVGTMHTSSRSHFRWVRGNDIDWRRVRHTQSNSLFISRTNETTIRHTNKKKSPLPCNRLSYEHTTQRKHNTQFHRNGVERDR